MTNKQRTWGQFATPADVADLLLGFCLRRPEDRLLDPSCGDGALLQRAARWRSWLDSTAATDSPQTLYGVELDADSAAVAGVSGLVFRRANFFTLDPAEFPPFDAVIGNPPYTRAEWIGDLDAAAEAQLPLFDDEIISTRTTERVSLLPRELRSTLNQRAGLYAYFFLHSLQFLREGGRLGFVVPNGWLDVAYGRELKQFLLDHFRILVVIESAVERWFGLAGVNTCVIVLERAADLDVRAANRVRFASLRRPLRELLVHAEDDPQRVAAAEQLISRLLPAVDRRTESLSVRVTDQTSLDPAARWGAMWRAPKISPRHSMTPLVPLNHWAEIQRGFTTGANRYFYLHPAQVEEWGIEPEYRQPLLKSLRGVHRLRLDRSACAHEWLAVPPQANLGGTRVADYLAWGVAQGIHRRRTCAGRHPWYVLSEPPPTALLVAKGVWQRHFAPLPDEPVAVDQQIYRVAPVPGVDPEVAAALLNSAWFALQCELHGRLNLGEGVLWLAAYELGEMELPDPRAINPPMAARLVQAFRQLAERPVAETAGDLNSLDRWSLDELVFDLMGLTAAERDTVRLALVERLHDRRHRAQNRPEY